jgi:hypothetical protein
MPKAVSEVYAIFDEAVARHEGVRPVEQGEGDSLVAAFTSASGAVAAAIEAQQALTEEDWPPGAEIAVRMALHTGDAQVRDDRFYVGPTIIRCARLRALAHGDQVLISSTTADLLADRLPTGAALLPLGLHRLRDLRQPERVFQLSHPALCSHFPPLRSLDQLPNNLPVQLTSFIGRETALAEIARITRVGGGVALFWNVRDRERSPFIEEYSLLLERHVEHGGDMGRYEAVGREQTRRAFEAHSAAFEPPEVIELHHAVEMTDEEFMGLAFTASYVRALPAPEQDRIRLELAALLGRHGLNHGRPFTVPYRLDLWISRRSEQ